MSFLELARTRRSVRAFLPDAVSDDTIAQLLEAARVAPSAGNRQPWRFFVIRRKSVLADIIEKSCKQPFIATAPVVFVVCADIPQTTPRYGDRGQNLYCIQDTAAAIQNLLLCAHDLGLGACWCGAFDEDAMAGVLGLDGGVRPVAIIPVGYPGGAAPQARGRRSVSDIATFIDE